MGATWHRILSEALAQTALIGAWAESGVVAAHCRDILGSAFLEHVLRVPYLAYLAQRSAQRDTAVPLAHIDLADVRALWYFCAPTDRTAVLKAFVQRVATHAGCAHCGKRAAVSTTPELLTCSRCHACAYCSRDCQRAHWRSHKASCHDAVLAESVAAGAAP